MSNNNVNLKISSIVQKHDIEANWNKASSFIPAKGQIIVYDIEVDKDGNTLELPTGRSVPYTYERVKIGDGITPVDELPFIVNNISNSTSTGGLNQLSNTGNAFDFTGKNPNATELDSTLTGSITYGATGDYATSLGGKSAAMGKRSVALGTTTIAKGNYSLATGDNSVTLGNDSFAAGYQTTAKGQASASFGSGTVSVGGASLALGKETVAEGDYSIAAGYQTLAKDQASVALGRGTVAENGATVVGRYNVEEPSAIFAVGCGDSDSRRSTAFTVWADGSVYIGSGPNGENSNWVATRGDIEYYLSDTVKDYWKLPSVPEGFAGGATRVPIQSITDGEVSGYGTLQVGKSWAAPGTLVQRDEAGNIIVAHPTEDEHAATKAYVDTEIANIDIPTTDLTGYATEYYVDTNTVALTKPERTQTINSKINITDKLEADVLNIHNNEIFLNYDRDSAAGIVLLTNESVSGLTGADEVTPAYGIKYVNGKLHIGNGAVVHGWPWEEDMTYADELSNNSFQFGESYVNEDGYISFRNTEGSAVATEEYVNSKVGDLDSAFFDSLY